MGRIAFWSVIAATLAVYLVMVIWSLPKVAEAAGGLVPFDLRPLGYSETEARAFLAALSDAGRRFYADVQHRLDLAYPALMAASLSLCFGRLIGSRAIRWTLIAVALGAMGADYAENVMVGQMLEFPSDSAPADLIARASTATVVKSTLGAVAITAVLVAVGVRIGGRWRRR
jgi:hypothetical protein